ncbi:flagellar biosynthesis anti-sigma factor FlgM [Ferviditalea candida]|uniref:Negative regulator of flagellin synthesis n=1 Tax=Ferviditalea candida TaxID=3108399 RepID=A0ABU5ZIL2_9BACL|nr:flagellar biosynthesis anti-sigma factor FlgM [Paenibacillaceae bacterium T2]
MKINDLQRIGGMNPYRKDTGTKASDNAGKRGKQKDEVHISQEAKMLHEVQEADLRSSRIQNLKQSVAAGTYHVEAQKIAEKLLPYLNS